MIVDLGQVAHLTASVTDSSGNAADVTTMTLVISLPDGTVTGALTATHGSTGSYSYDYTPTQAGRHLVSWTGTGGAGSPFAYTDVLNVWPADPRFLFSLDDAKAALNWASITAATKSDQELRLYIAAVTPVIEDIVGTLVVGSFTETYDGGSTRIALVHYPVTAVSSVIESYGSAYQRTLTVQNIFSGGSSDTFGYTVENETGLLTRRAGGIAVPFAQGQRNIQVTYSAGRAQIPPNVMLAAREELRFLWQVGQQGNRPTFDMQMGQTDMAFTPSGFAVPRRVVELCRSNERIPGIA